MRTWRSPRRSRIFTRARDVARADCRSKVRSHGVDRRGVSRSKRGKQTTAAGQRVQEGIRRLASVGLFAKAVSVVSSPCARQEVSSIKHAQVSDLRNGSN